MRALASATRETMKKAGIPGDRVQAIALDTTGSSVIPVGKDLQPLGEYYLWCDHRARARLPRSPRWLIKNPGSHPWCGGVYSSEWGFFQVAALAAAQPDKRSQFVSAFEHCDMVRPRSWASRILGAVKRRHLLMGHKWLGNAHAGRPSTESFLIQGGSFVEGVRRPTGWHVRSRRITWLAGFLRFGGKAWRQAGIPRPVGAFERALGDAIGGWVPNDTW